MFYNHDHLGNTRVAYSPRCSGGVLTYALGSAVDYYPYGKVSREYNEEAMRYQSTHNERDRETGYDFRNARSSAADVVRFGSVDPLEGSFASWSPYGYVMGNPLRMIDPSGMRTYFVDEAGNHLYTSDDNEEDAVTVVNDVFSFNFYRKWVWEAFGSNINDLRNMGVSYLLKDIKKFAQTPNPPSQDGIYIFSLSDTYYSNPKRAFSENGAMLYTMSDNPYVVRVNTNYVYTNYKATKVIVPDDKDYYSKTLPDGANVVGYIHDHENTGYNMAEKMGRDFVQIYGSEPGPSKNVSGIIGDDGDMRHSRTPPYHNIVLDKGRIYFYGYHKGYTSNFSVPLNPF